MKRLTKRQREERALDTIIAATLRGWGKKEWDKVFQRMADLESANLKAAKLRFEMDNDQ